MHFFNVKHKERNYNVPGIFHNHNYFDIKSESIFFLFLDFMQNFTLTIKTILDGFDHLSSGAF